MLLTELGPRWLLVAGEDSFYTSEEKFIDPAISQGIMFCDPIAFKQNNGFIGTSQIIVWFKDRGVPDTATPGPARWLMIGKSFSELTLSPSIDCSCGGKYPNEWHGWIKQGVITNA
jgi:hypothetical protein